MTSRIQYNNPQGAESLGLPYHYEMVSDKKRVGAFKKAIMKSCKGKIVLESGAGSGILSILAAKAGAKKVYAIEIDTIVADFAKENIKKCGYENIITILNKDVRKVSLKDIGGEKIDVVIAENLTTWEVTEPQIPVMNHINKFLIKKEGIRIPTIIFNTLELCESQYRFENLVDVKTYYFEFSGIRKNKVLSEKTLFQKVDLREINSMSIAKKIEIKVSKNGTLNSIRLTSPIEIYGTIMFDSSDSLMPPVIVPLKNEINVKRGDIIELLIKYNYNTSWKLFECIAKLNNKK